MAISKKRVELIIILLFILLLSAIWIWYGLRLKEIDQKKRDTATGRLINQATAAKTQKIFSESISHHTN